ncbi:hypothetical protein BHM03_00037272 [Ensete ventricosum]|nr:hypothetical protein BHM03_00037272 [Ensete ventricosum]
MFLLDHHRQPLFCRFMHGSDLLTFNVCIRSPPDCSSFLGLQARRRVRCSKLAASAMAWKVTRATSSCETETDRMERQRPPASAAELVGGVLSWLTEMRGDGVLQGERSFSHPQEEAMRSEMFSSRGSEDEDDSCWYCCLEFAIGDNSQWFGLGERKDDDETKAAKREGCLSAHVWSSVDGEERERGRGRESERNSKNTSFPRREKDETTARQRG